MPTKPPLKPPTSSPPFVPELPERTEPEAPPPLVPEKEHPIVALQAAKRQERREARLKEKGY